METPENREWFITKRMIGNTEAESWIHRDAISMVAFGPELTKVFFTSEAEAYVAIAKENVERLKAWLLS